MAITSPPPHGLDLLIDFVNTLDREENTDTLASPGDLGSWLLVRGLLAANGANAASATGASERDLQRALELREALRRLMLANNGAPLAENASRELERAARRGRLSVHFQAGAVQIEPDAEGVAGALARLLTPIALAIGDGTWQRVKACSAPDCEWAFYDRSRNRSGVWCNMAVCGNRTKVRAYRERAPRQRD